MCVCVSEWEKSVYVFERERDIKKKKSDTKIGLKSLLEETEGGGAESKLHRIADQKGVKQEQTVCA